MRIDHIAHARDIAALHQPMAPALIAHHMRRHVERLCHPLRPRKRYFGIELATDEQDRHLKVGLYGANEWRISVRPSRAGGDEVAYHKTTDEAWIGIAHGFNDGEIIRRVRALSGQGCQSIAPGV
jgi:hypothetical protein